MGPPSPSTRQVPRRDALGAPVSRFSQEYDKVRVIGNGSYGSAVLCARRRDDALLVVKILKTRQGNRERAQNEIRILKQLHHPNIVQYFDHWQDGERLFISMEYAEDGDLRAAVTQQRRRGRPFPERLVVSWMLQLASALYYIHSMRVLHRDIKSNNIFLAERGRVIKVGDFGISKQLDASTDFARTVIGTPYYLSPEIVDGKKYNSKSDVWSVGVLLHEIMTFEYPFQAATQQELFALIRGGRRPRASSRGYSAGLLDLLDSLLDCDRRRRPSARQLLRAPVLRADADRGRLLPAGPCAQAPAPAAQAAPPPQADAASARSARQAAGPLRSPLPPPRTPPPSQKQQQHNQVTEYNPANYSAGQAVAAAAVASVRGRGLVSCPHCGDVLPAADARSHRCADAAEHLPPSALHAPRTPRGAPPGSGGAAARPGCRTPPRARGNPRPPAKQAQAPAGGRPRRRPAGTPAAPSPSPYAPGKRVRDPPPAGTPQRGRPSPALGAGARRPAAGGREPQRSPAPSPRVPPAKSPQSNTAAAAAAARSAASAAAPGIAAVAAVCCRAQGKDRVDDEGGGRDSARRKCSPATARSPPGVPPPRRQRFATPEPAVAPPAELVPGRQKGCGTGGSGGQSARSQATDCQLYDARSTALPRSASGSTSPLTPANGASPRALAAPAPAVLRPAGDGPALSSGTAAGVGGAFPRHPALCAPQEGCSPKLSPRRRCAGGGGAARSLYAAMQAAQPPDQPPLVTPTARSAVPQSATQCSSEAAAPPRVLRGGAAWWSPLAPPQKEAAPAAPAPAAAQVPPVLLRPAGGGSVRSTSRSLWEQPRRSEAREALRARIRDHALIAGSGGGATPRPLAAGAAAALGEMAAIAAEQQQRPQRARSGPPHRSPPLADAPLSVAGPFLSPLRAAGPCSPPRRGPPPLGWGPLGGGGGEGSRSAPSPPRSPLSISVDVDISGCTAGSTLSSLSFSELPPSSGTRALRAAAAPRPLPFAGGQGDRCRAVSPVSAVLPGEQWARQAAVPPLLRRPCEQLPALPPAARRAPPRLPAGRALAAALCAMLRRGLAPDAAAHVMRMASAAAPPPEGPPGRLHADPLALACRTPPHRRPQWERSPALASLHSSDVSADSLLTPAPQAGTASPPAGTGSSAARRRRSAPPAHRSPASDDRDPTTPVCTDVARSLAETLREVDSVGSEEDEDFEDCMPQMLDMLAAGTGRPQRRRQTRGEGGSGGFEGFRTLGGSDWVSGHIEGITGDDTPCTQAEGLGKALEDVLGLPLFLRVYRMLSAEGVGCSRRRRGRVVLQRARKELGPERAHLLHLIVQLIHFSDSFNREQQQQDVVQCP
eukprot:TRINITY_DN11642_c0_g1_i1.p1 TRINITY_DN11642_c0_g1~~TRINITY_DN11642_c0_g1_i1.p1  ORF type:complete len:1343 (+),score=305.81 TRINITY_DN11642_c0_g1_i1:76-4104(+)